MGKTFKVNSEEELCAMMCDNYIPEEEPKWYYFTFGHGQPNAGHYVKIFGTYGGAREKMFAKYDKRWAFQYSEEEWDAWVKKATHEGVEYMIEKELEVID